MADQYFIRVRGKVTGPFTEQELLRMATQRRLASFHEISSDRVHWQAAFTRSDLFPHAPAPLSALSVTAADGVYCGEREDGTIPVESSQDSGKMYRFSLQGDTYGPVSLERLGQMIVLGQMGPNDLVAGAGGDVFVPASELPELARHFSIAANATASIRSGIRKNNATLLPGDEMTAGEIALALLIPAAGIVLGIIWLAQGKPKGGKVFGISVLCSIAYAMIILLIVQVTNP